VAGAASLGHLEAAPAADVFHVCTPLSAHTELARAGVGLDAHACTGRVDDDAAAEALGFGRADGGPCPSARAVTRETAYPGLRELVRRTYAAITDTASRPSRSRRPSPWRPPATGFSSVR